jgi:hypothetical protein
VAAEDAIEVRTDGLTELEAIAALEQVVQGRRTL